MNQEIKNLYEEIKEYIVINEKGWALKENAPKEVKEKFNILMKLDDDETIIKSK